jgi:hypothetical protein
LALVIEMTFAIGAIARASTTTLLGSRGFPAAAAQRTY